MLRAAMLVVLVLLAQALNDPRSRPTAPAPSGAHLDRHIDAHIAPREATPSASPNERPSRDAPPEPAIGTVAPVDPSPPAIQLYRDPLYRDRR